MPFFLAVRVNRFHNVFVFNSFLPYAIFLLKIADPDDKGSVVASDLLTIFDQISTHTLIYKQTLGILTNLSQMECSAIINLANPFLI